MDKLINELEIDETCRRCTQTKCVHYIKGGCRACESCGSKSYLINTECRRCLVCEGKEGELRWGDGKFPPPISIPESSKEDLNKDKPGLLILQEV